MNACLRQAALHLFRDQGCSRPLQWRGDAVISPFLSAFPPCCLYGSGSGWSGGLSHVILRTQFCGLIPCRAVYTTYRVWPAVGGGGPETYSVSQNSCVPFPAMQLVLPGGGRPGQRRGDAVISLTHVIAWRPLPCCLYGLRGGLPGSALGALPRAIIGTLLP